MPREKDNWSSRAVNVEAKYNTKEAWHDKDGQAAAPAHELLRRRQHQVLRRGAVSAAQGGLRRAARTTAACRPRGRSATTSSSRTTRRPSTSIRCTASAAWIRPSRGRARPTASRPSSTSRASSSCTTTSRAQRPQAVPRAARHHARREGSAQEPVHPLRDLRRLSLPGPRQERRAGHLRRPGARASERDADDQRQGHAPDDQRRRGARSPASPSTHTARRDLSPPTSSSSSCGAINSAALLLRSANDRHPNGLANGSGRRRPPLHGPRQLGAAGDLEDAEPDGVPEDAGGQRLLLRRRRISAFRWATSRSSASSTRWRSRRARRRSCRA